MLLREEVTETEIAGVVSHNGIPGAGLEEKTS